VQVLAGRYGPYVKHGEVNATLPRGKEPAALTVEEAVQLIAERVAKGPAKGSKSGGRRGRTSTTKTARADAAPKQANGAPAKNTKSHAKNGKDDNESRAKAPPAKGKAPRSRKAAT
jgi:DNA topoisomerase-1